MSDEKSFIKIDKLKKYFPIYSGILKRTIGAVKAVDDVSFSIKSGETLGLVGESGSGKSTLGRTIIQLYEPTSGKVYYKSYDLLMLKQREFQKLRLNLQIIFQDPFASLDPRMTVGEIILEPLAIHKLGTKKEQREKVEFLMNKVGLTKAYKKYPHEFSGGQCQRIAIARALATEPEFVVCDEPISSLDVSIQAQVVNLLEELQDDLGLTYLFIAHDLRMTRHISDRVAIMYLGKIVELASKDEFYSHPLHPYTKGLLSSIPTPDPINERKRQRVYLKGEIPNPSNPPKGCRYHTRCPIADGKICREVEPQWRDVGSDHWVACHKV